MSVVSPNPGTVTSRADFAAALTALREQAGLTVRELARRVDARPATLGGYFSGRHLPPANQNGTLLAILRECGVTDTAAIADWLEASNRARSTSDRRSRETRPPFRGLASFEVQDAAMFFGRTAETRRLVQLVRSGEHPTIAVVGPSGSGKSSVLRAGLMAAIGAGDLDRRGDRDERDGRYACVLVTPGLAPSASLSGALSQLPDAGPRVLVIDQLEELFTSRYDLDERYLFLDILDERDPDVIVVFGLRADFYAAASREPPLLAALQDAQVLVGPMDNDTVRETITGPAEKAGLVLENGLVDVVLADLWPVGLVSDVRAVSSLPLMAHALLATWTRSTGGRLTIAEYRATGGIGAAVERTAETVFSGLSGSGQRTARELFLRMITVDDIVVTRRRLPWSELDGLADDVGDVSSTFVDARLLTATTEGLEMSHEALLSSWPRLRAWIDDDRESLRLRRRIIDGSREWEESGRDPALLLRGAQLHAATEWVTKATPSLALTSVEQEYLVQGDVESARTRRRATRARRRLRWMSGTTALLAAVAVVLAVVSIISLRAAERSERTARTARDDALSGRVALQATMLTQDDPALAQQLALVAAQIAPTDEAKAAITAQSATPVVTRVLGAVGPTPLALAANGRTIAVGHADDGSVHLYHVHPRQRPNQLSVVPGDGRGQLFALAFSRDARLLATGGQNARVTIWDVANARAPHRVAVIDPHFDGAVESLAFSPDGRVLVGSSAGAHPVQRWAISAAGRPSPLAPPRGVPATATVQTVAFDRSGSWLAAGGSAGTLLLWPADRAARSLPRVLKAPQTTTVDSVAFAPDGDPLYAGEYGGRVEVWPTTRPADRPVRTLRGATDSRINVVTVSSDGTEVAAGAGDNTLERWDTATGEVRDITHNPGPVTGVQYSNDDDRVLSTAADGTLRIVRRIGKGLPIQGNGFALSFSQDGSRLAVGTGSSTLGNVRVWDVRDRNEPYALTPPLRMPDGGAIDGTGALRFDGRLVAAADQHGRIRLWSLDAKGRATPVVTFTDNDSLIEAVTFSPDGRLLAAASDHHDITLFDVHDPVHPRRISSVSGHDLMLGVAFSPDGRLLAGANADDHAYVWNVASPTQPRLAGRLGGFTSYVYGVSFDRTGHLLAATSSDHTTRVWQVSDDDRFAATGHVLKGPTDYVYSASFSADGAELAIGSNDGSVRLYNLARGAEVPSQTLRGLGAPVFAVAYNPVNDALYATGRAASVITWKTSSSPQVYADRICPLIGDRITRTEWRLYVGTSVPYKPPCP